MPATAIAFDLTRIDIPSCAGSISSHTLGIACCSTWLCSSDYTFSSVPHDRPPLHSQISMAAPGHSFWEMNCFSSRWLHPTDDANFGEGAERGRNYDGCFHDYRDLTWVHLSREEERRSQDDHSMVGPTCSRPHRMWEQDRLICAFAEMSLCWRPCRPIFHREDSNSGWYSCHEVRGS